MPGSSGRLTKLWQELKRRKVFGVVTAYAATAYIIIEVTNNLVDTLHLADWIGPLVILLLVIGLPVAVVLSWIFDFTPKGIKKTESLEESGDKEIVTEPAKRKLRPSYILNAVLIIAVIILAYPKIFNRETLDDLRSRNGRISLAVMPFQNLTKDTTWDLWEKGIQTSLIYSLSNNPEELTVRESESVNNLVENEDLKNIASITPSVAGSISKRLDAKVFINGTINIAGSKIRLNAQLTNSKTKEIFKSFQIDGTAENFLYITDSLSLLIRNFLVISKMGKESSPDLQPCTNSPDAYRYFMLAADAFDRGDIKGQIDNYSLAIGIDSNFIPAIIFLSMRYMDLGLYDDARKWCLKAYEKRDQVPVKEKIMAEWYHALLFITPKEEILYLKQYQDVDDQVPVSYWQTGNAYLKLFQYSKAIPEYEKALEIYKEWKIKPMMAANYTTLGFAYHKTGEYKKERKLYKKAQKDFPNDDYMIYRQAVLALTQKNVNAANAFIEKFKSLEKENSISDASIATSLASLFSESGLSDKAEEYFRKALSLDPENPGKMDDLGLFLIDKERNINEGIELIDKALTISPGSWYMLANKGWGLYMQGKYQEALELLEKSWDLKPVYDHELFLSLEKAKKAAAEQK